MIVDACMYNGEADILKIRLAELWPVVDRFVILENVWTHQGQAKSDDLLLAAVADSLGPWRSKIVEVLVDIRHYSSWEAERQQRDALRRGFEDCPADSLILVSDVDEIPSADAVRLAALRPDGITAFDMRQHYYWLNCRGNEPGPFTRAARKSLVDQHGANDIRRAGQHPPLPLACVLPDAGWHYSYMGGAETIQRKLRSFAHTEYSHAPYTDLDYIIAHMNAPADLFDRAGHDYWFVPVDETFPKFVRDHLDYYSRHIYQPDSCIPADIRGHAWAM